MSDDAVCFYYGFKSTNMVKEVYKNQVKTLSKMVQSKIKNKEEELNKEYRELIQNKPQLESIKGMIDPFSTSMVPQDLASGCIINTMVTSYENPVETIQKVSKWFKADYIIVIDHEKTYINLTETYKNNSHMKLIKLPRSSGVFSAGEAHKISLRNLSFKKYFNGKMSKFDTFEVGLDLGNYILYTIEIVKIPLSALPQGAKEEAQKIMVKHADPRTIPLQNKIIGVLDPLDVEKLDKFENDGEDSGMKDKEDFYKQIITSLCRSLVQVHYYDPDKNHLVVNATSPEGIKSKHLIIGELTYEKDI